jgi:hypothetical protein
VGGGGICVDGVAAGGFGDYETVDEDVVVADGYVEYVA